MHRICACTAAVVDDGTAAVVDDGEKEGGRLICGGDSVYSAFRFSPLL